MTRIAAALLLLACSCGGESAPKEERCDRIISLVPSVTEMLYEVGAGDRIVGVTTYCTYPPEAGKKEKIGSLRVSYEAVAALKPDAAFTRGTMTAEATLALEEMGIRVVRVDAESFEGIARELKRLGRLTGRAEKGEKAAADLLARVRAVEEKVKGKPRPTVYVETTPDPIGTAGSDSYIGDLIRRAGGENIIGDLGHPWGKVSWEVVLKRDPEVILIAHTHAAEIERRPGWAGLRAVKNKRVHVVPEEEFILPTSRLALGLERAAKLFHETD